MASTPATRPAPARTTRTAEGGRPGAIGGSWARGDRFRVRAPAPWPLPRAVSTTADRKHAPQPASHQPSCPSTRNPAAYVATTAEMANSTRAVRRSLHSKPCSTTSSMRNCGNGPRRTASRPVTLPEPNAIAATPARATQATMSRDQVGRSPPERLDLVVTAAPVIVPAASRAIVNGDEPRAPTSNASPANVAAAVVHLAARTER